MPKRSQQFQRTYAQILAKAWSDASLMQRLLTDPAAVLREHGLNVPAGLNVKVIELEPNTVYLSVPPRPNVTDESLSQVAAGAMSDGESIGDVVIMGTFSAIDPEP